LRARANNQYGITDASQRYTEVNIYRLRNSMFKQNTITSLSNIMLGLYLTQSADTLWYNTYYDISGDACQAIFVQDKNNDGSIVLPTDSIYFSFHQYAKRTGYDQNSSCEGQSYSPTGCGMPPAAFMSEILSLEELPVNKIAAYPNPAVNEIFVKLNLQNSGMVTVQLVDLSGRIVLNQQQQLTKGNQLLTVKGIKQRGITPGVYMLKISTADEVKTIKIAVQ